MFIPKVSIIISVYKNINALELIFKALMNQSFKAFEIIVAEDDSDIQVKEFLSDKNSKFVQDVVHVSQVDDGFRKNAALNKAIAVSKSPYLIFIDGDCIPHRQFIKQHFENRETKKVLFGRRVMLSETLTSQLYEEKNLDLLTIKNLFLFKCKQIEDGFYLPFWKSSLKKTNGIWGCNWSIHKQELVDINGFDEDFTQPGFGEDVDVEWRLKKNGVSLKKMKYKAIQYHLHHSLNYKSTDAMEALMKEKINNGHIYCKNGLDKYQ